MQDEQDEKQQIRPDNDFEFILQILLIPVNKRFFFPICSCEQNTLSEKVESL